MTNVSLCQPTTTKPDERFRASYLISLYDKSSGEGRLKVWTDNAIWDAENPALAMMIKARGVIKNRAAELGLEFDGATAKVFMNLSWPWELLWKAFENEMNKARVELSKLSIITMKGHLCRTQAIKDSKWERGTPFSSSAVQSFAKQAVMDEVGKRTENNLCREEMILSGIVTDLSKEGLDECAVLSKATQEDVHAFSLLLKNAKLVIQGIQGSAFNLRNAKLLTGFCAIMFPGDDTEEASASIRHFSRLFGMNRQAKYVTIGLKNRRQFNEFIQRKGDLVAGERVCCAGSDDATVIQLEPDGHITLQLHPFETVKQYKNFGCAKVVRWQPPLDEYSRNERADITPCTDKRLIYTYFKREVPELPNKKDTVILRHPDFPSQFKEERKMYRFETFDELWAGFQKCHPTVYEKSKTKVQKKPTLLPRYLGRMHPSR